MEERTTSTSGRRGRAGIDRRSGVVVVVVRRRLLFAEHAAANGSTATGATTVQRRNLIETDTESGTLSYNSPQTVYNRLTGTITWLPKVGQVIKPGGRCTRSTATLCC